MESRSSFFDSRAGQWEETCYPPPVRKRLVDLIAAFDVKPGDRVLDVGTGPGVLLPYLHRRVGPSGRICAFDLSFEMVRQASSKPLTHRDLVFQGDVHFIPFADGAFDRVICFAAFPHFHDARQALQEMGRVLKPGGVIVVAHLMSREELAAHHGAHETVARDLLPPESEMKALFVQAGLHCKELIDTPGRYLARGVKV